jgi:hypothetical protein
MLSSPVCDLAPELQTSEIPEGFMKSTGVNITGTTNSFSFNKYLLINKRMSIPMAAQS